MTTAKNTRRALLISTLAILMCVAMLIGTTFAWFTDSASTSVNTIKSGLLDVQLVNENGTDLTGTELTWKTADSRATPIYWEPGCTYDIQSVYVKNNGDLALKYKIAITGINGDAVLNDVIEWTVNGSPLGAEYSLGVGRTSEALTIRAHMLDTADDDYQGKSIDGISITVYATQDDVEYDSNGNTYDKTADGTPQYNTWNDNVAVTATVKTDAPTVIEDNDAEPSIKVVVPQGSTTATALTLVKSETATPANIKVETGTEALTAEVKIVNQNGAAIAAEGDKFFTLSMEIGKNLNVVNLYHNGTPLTKAADENSLTANDMYYYNAGTGYVTFTTDDFSPFTVVVSNSAFNGGDGTEAHPYLIANGDQAYEIKSFNKENKSLYFKLIDNVVTTKEIFLNQSTATIDLNGYSIKLEYGSDVEPNNGGVFNLGSTSSLTINDSSVAKTGAVIGSGGTYDGVVTCAVKVGSYAELTIKGGYFYGKSEATSCIFVKTTNKEKAKSTVTINGGKFETASALDGIYYVLNHQDNYSAGCTITVNGGSFRNYNPGVTKVDPESTTTGTISLGTGYKTTQNGEWYTVVSK